MKFKIFHPKEPSSDGAFFNDENYELVALVEVRGANLEDVIDLTTDGDDHRWWEKAGVVKCYRRTRSLEPGDVVVGEDNNRLMRTADGWNLV
jgi:hypothetical protein